MSALDLCGNCGRERGMPCRNTRDMEEGDRLCFDALTRIGGGERSHIQAEAARREEFWQRYSATRYGTFADPISRDMEHG